MPATIRARAGELTARPRACAQVWLRGKRENDEGAMVRWHPTLGWVIAKLQDSSGMNYSCRQGTAKGRTPLECGSFGHPNDVCKVRECGDAANQLGDGEGAEPNRVESDL